MDPLTHTLLGASTCQALYSRKLGRKGIAFGALAAALPDIDILGGIMFGPFVGFTTHRGPTHSLWFPFVIGPLLGYLTYRLLNKPPSRLSLIRKPWMIMFTIAILSHPLLDVCTTYGTQLLTPFSHHRFALDAIAVVDPFYTLILLLSVSIGWWALRPRLQRFKLARTTACFALMLSTAYIVYGGFLNQKAEEIASQDLASSDGNTWRVHAYPTLLQLYGRHLVARSPDQTCVGFLSLWNTSPVAWQCAKQIRDPKIDLVRQTPEGKIFEWFAMKMTFATLTPEQDYSVVQIYDLRYALERPDQGVWYIQAKVSPQDRLLGAVTYRQTEISPPVMRQYLKALWLKTFKN